MAKIQNWALIEMVKKIHFWPNSPHKLGTFTSWEHCQVLPPYCMTIFCVIKSNIYWREREGRRNPRRQFFFLAMSRDHLQWESSSIALTHYQKKKNDERGNENTVRKNEKRPLRHFPVKSIYSMHDLLVK